MHVYTHITHACGYVAIDDRDICTCPEHHNLSRDHPVNALRASTTHVATNREMGVVRLHVIDRRIDRMSRETLPQNAKSVSTKILAARIKLAIIQLRAHRLRCRRRTAFRDQIFLVRQILVRYYFK